MNKYNNRYDIKFSQKEFMKTFFVLLYKNGINTIDVRELEAILYSYYQNPEYKEIFEDISIKRIPHLTNQIDLDRGTNYIISETNITYDIIDPYVLKLHYDENADSYSSLNKLSLENKELIIKMAKEVSIVFKLQSKSKIPLRIYKEDPSQTYDLYDSIDDNEYGSHIRFDLITDGVLAYYEDENLFASYVRNPRKFDYWVKLENRLLRFVDIMDASFAIKRGIENDELGLIEIHALKINTSYLNKLIKISKQRLGEEENLISSSPYVSSPYVKKIKL